MCPADTSRVVVTFSDHLIEALYFLSGQQSRVGEAGSIIVV